MRLHDWESRFAAYIARVAREGFQPGQHDCALFAAGAVEAVTGTDPAADWRGRYKTLPEGLRLIRAAGWADHVAAARAMFPAILPTHVLPADLAVIGTGADAALGAVQGAVVYVLRESGLGLVPIEQASELLGVR